MADNSEQNSFIEMVKQKLAEHLVQEGVKYLKHAIFGIEPKPSIKPQPPRPTSWPTAQRPSVSWVSQERARIEERLKIQRQQADYATEADKNTRASNEEQTKEITKNERAERQIESHQTESMAEETISKEAVQAVEEKELAVKNETMQQVAEVEDAKNLAEVTGKSVITEAGMTAPADTAAEPASELATKATSSTEVAGSAAATEGAGAAATGAEAAEAAEVAAMALT